MSKRLLQEIMNIDGVEGVFIASGRAKIIDKMGLKYGDDQLEEIIFPAYCRRISPPFSENK
jgi:hypothetical protein